MKTVIQFCFSLIILCANFSLSHPLFASPSLFKNFFCRAGPMWVKIKTRNEKILFSYVDARRGKELRAELRPEDMTSGNFGFGVTTFLHRPNLGESHVSIYGRIRRNRANFDIYSAGAVGSNDVVLDNVLCIQLNRSSFEGEFLCKNDHQTLNLDVHKVASDEYVVAINGENLVFTKEYVDNRGNQVTVISKIKSQDKFDQLGSKLVFNLTQSVISDDFNFTLESEDGHLFSCD